jgi:hypothetical protein
MGLDVPPLTSAGPLARVDPRPRTGGFCGGSGVLSLGLLSGVGAFCVKTLLIAPNGLLRRSPPRDPRSVAAGPVGGPRLTGEGRALGGPRPLPRGPLGAFGMLLCKAGPGGTR